MDWSLAEKRGKRSEEGSRSRNRHAQHADERRQSAEQLSHIRSFIRATFCAYHSVSEKEAKPRQGRPASEAQPTKRASRISHRKASRFFTGANTCWCLRPRTLLSREWSCSEVRKRGAKTKRQRSQQTRAQHATQRQHSRNQPSKRCSFNRATLGSCNA